MKSYVPDKNQRAFIFDMDGVIIDSEPFWRRAQIEELHKFGIKITPDDCIKQTMGLRIDAVASTWCSLFDITIASQELENKILNSVAQLILEYGTAKPGLMALLDYLKLNRFKIGIATSSSKSIIDAVMDRLQIRHYFEVICSADDETYGKPHPAVYQTALQKLQVQKENCIILEDSINGLISAKAASIKTYVIPEQKEDPRFAIADGIFSSMDEIIPVL